jgi:hypothetical protein
MLNKHRTISTRRAGFRRTGAWKGFAGASLLSYLFAIPGLLLIPLAASCRPAGIPPGGGPMTDSLFVELLIDLHVGNARAERWNDLPPAFLDSVLSAHRVARPAYEAAVTFYTAHPEAYLAVYDRAMDRLNEERFSRD